MAKQKGHGFGTAPVFLAGISTILGAILFLRFGYAVANVGLGGSLLIIVLGHLITIPTALAIAEIATNLKVEGGGEYFIISRSFGLTLGGTIGISLYLSQAISVAFYIIAFTEACRPLFGLIESNLGFSPQLWMIGIPATLFLLLIILTKGADLGVSVLWVVVSILGISLFMFFLGHSTESGTLSPGLFDRMSNADEFFVVFAIVFPAFTGMTAGVGLSGDLKRPRKSIPLGTISASLVGMGVYILVVIKLAYNLPLEVLARDQFAMSRIALWGPIIPIGLGAASLSSAIGSILIAPRTLQALGKDGILPMKGVNPFLSKGRGEKNEPVNATIITTLIVILFVSMGSVNFVAKMISMFFMITYGSLCLVSLLEHFGGNPTYRPTFRTKWYISLFGALACFIVMFNMSLIYAIIAVLAIIIIYLSVKHGREGEDDLSIMLKGVLYQLTRNMQIYTQKRSTEFNLPLWRPSFIAVSSTSFERLALFDLLRWISQYYGFGTYVHFIKGMLDKDSQIGANRTQKQLVSLGIDSQASVYVDTIISPSFKTALAQIIQMPGISGMENNSILFEFPNDDTSGLEDIITGCHFATYVDYSICVLRSSDTHFGYKRRIHIWLTPGDYRNATLIILLAYIIAGHPDWKGCEIELCGAFGQDELNKEIRKLNALIDKGRIPISSQNIRKIAWDKKKKSYEEMVIEYSKGADLTIMGFSLDKITKEKGDFFTRFKEITDIMFVRAAERIVIHGE